MGAGSASLVAAIALVGVIWQGWVAYRSSARTTGVESRKVGLDEGRWLVEQLRTEVDRLTERVATLEAEVQRCEQQRRLDRSWIRAAIHAMRDAGIPPPLMPPDD